MTSYEMFYFPHSYYMQSPMNIFVSLTYSRGKEWHLLHVLAVIVHCQVPDARVHVLDETSVMAAKEHQASRLSQSRRSVQALNPLSQEPPSIQKLHKVKLEAETETMRPQTSISMTYKHPYTHSYTHTYTYRHSKANKGLTLNGLLLVTVSVRCEICVQE